MDRRNLREEDRIAELNRELREDQDYREGMAFVPLPEGATGCAIIGYTTTGPAEWTHVYARVAYRVLKQARSDRD